MIRVLVNYGLPFLLPFAAYVGYVYLIRRAEAAGIRWQDGPWVSLALAGTMLAIASFLFTAFTTGGDPHGTYVPAHTEDGRVVPAEVK